MARKFLFLLIIVVAVGFFSKNINKEDIKEVLIGPQVKIGDDIFFVDIADDEGERYLGLSGYPNLGRDAGMLFLFDRTDIYTFWMKGMNFPIDIIWIRGDKVVGISRDLQPEASVTPNPKLYPAPAIIDKVLEINAGQADERGIGVGDVVAIQIATNDGE